MPICTAVRVGAIWSSMQIKRSCSTARAPPTPPVTDERGGLPVEPQIGSLTHLQADGEHSVKLTNR
jgi:hypothetical protein